MRITRRQAIRIASGDIAATLGSLGSACGPTKKVVEPTLLERLAFGSCNHQDHLQTHWPFILEQNPQLWLWMGDAIYADEALPRVREREYLRLLQDKNYAALLEQAYVLGTWDDHDYATNDAGGDYEYRFESQQAFLNFIGEDADSPRRVQEGIYTSKDIGTGEQVVQMILMDLRYHAEKPGLTADNLGPAQWEFLEREIRRSGPQLKILVSSLQFLTTYTGKETWASFPTARMRLLNLIAESTVPVLILSGDRHLSEYARFDLGNGSVLAEVTSSGLTHFQEKSNPNPYRVGEQVNSTNFGVLDLRWSPEKKLERVGCRIHSPQSGDVHREFDIELVWKTGG